MIDGTMHTIMAPPQGVCHMSSPKSDVMWVHVPTQLMSRDESTARRDPEV